jgi:hypothetical protein
LRSQDGGAQNEKVANVRKIAAALAALLVLSPPPVFGDPASGQPVGPDRVGCNSAEIMTEHIHAHLTIAHDGHVVPVPAGIGIVQAAGIMLCIYWLHTHDDSGTIHIEAPGGNFTLADFFAVWGEPLSRTRVGPYAGRVSIKINGAPYAGAPQSIPLTNGEHIALSVR